MAEVNLKGDIVTGLDATPRTYLGPKRVGGVLREDRIQFTTNSDDSADSTYHLFRVPSNAVISQLLGSTDGDSTDGTAHIGLYRSTDDGGAVVDADLFASAWAIKTAARNSDLTYESGVIDVEDQHKELWQLAGATEDPGGYYDIVMTIVEAITAAANNMEFKLRYVVAQ